MENKLLQVQKVSNPIDIQFKEAYLTISRMSQDQFAPDIMLKLYAYYKQATYGDNDPDFLENDDLNLRNGFKLNAWIQLRGMSIEDAKREYIKIVNSL